jgi:MFS family permease
MSVSDSSLRSHLTLGLSTILHAFTHAYGSMLVPLYLLMVSDLKLPGVKSASLIVTLTGLVTCVLSYGAGVLADRFNRKALLGIGLLGHAAAITAMGLTRHYEWLLADAVVAGLFATLFHPSANALIPAHYPKSPGMVIGLLGIGAGIGFFAGPQFAGWRAQSATWTFLSVADWQKPLIEAGVSGMVIAILFLLIAREIRAPSGRSGRRSVALGPALRWRVAQLSLVLGCRDFAGLASLSLASIYLQKAHGYDAKRTGFIIGTMMLTSVVVNPLLVYLTAGRRRLAALALILVVAGGVIATVPLWPVRWILAVLMAYQALQLGSYAVSDAAMLERVDAERRGRVVGLFLTIAGTFASLSPFVMGWWTDRLGDRAAQPAAYLPIFGTLGAMMVIAAFATPLIARLGKPQGGAIDPISETMAATVELGM